MKQTNGKNLDEYEIGKWKNNFHYWRESVALSGVESRRSRRESRQGHFMPSCLFSLFHETEMFAKTKQKW